MKIYKIAINPETTPEQRAEVYDQMFQQSTAEIISHMARGWIRELKKLTDHIEECEKTGRQWQYNDVELEHEEWVKNYPLSWGSEQFKKMVDLIVVKANQVMKQKNEEQKKREQNTTI